MTGQPASKPETKYETDYVAWTREQAEMLRSRRWDGLDLDHLIEEIEDLGGSDLAAVESHLVRVVEHLLKLEHSPARNPRDGWEDSVDTHRALTERRIARSKSLVRRIDLDGIYRTARRLAAKSLQRHDGLDPAVLPTECPYTLDQILDPDWLPENTAFPERA
ncbi:DUF29 domain-containing protein [Skermanella mucosa]|uniref:DUF29 domain-containing protein n=1 Tax=Skermanella mucosa TaxID=1789672 RepID=UPI00192C83C4|nr:DUF29 domain-containing protein [Skermanella mucosa]UEM20473.1 DUF29 domain-containing protein [Skermanella mucosa]